MPNWCANDLTITHDNPEAMKELVAAYKEGRLLNFAVPMPPEFNDDGKWYEWRITNWGTKWDVSPDQDPAFIGKNFHLVFDSAWAPPVEAMNALADRGYRLTMYYIEPGMSFAGCCRGDDDGFFDDSGVFGDLPAHVQEFYGDYIHEYMEHMKEGEE